MGSISGIIEHYRVIGIGLLEFNYGSTKKQINKSKKGK